MVAYKKQLPPEPEKKIVRPNKALLLVLPVVMVILLLLKISIYLVVNEEKGRESLNAVITELSGKVFVQTESALEPILAVEGQVLQKGDILKTGSKSFVEIVFSDNSLCRAGADTNIHFNNLYRTVDGLEVNTLSIDSGIVWNNVNPQKQNNSKFQLLTPSSVIAVEGTIFAVEIATAEDLESSTESEYDIYPYQESVNNEFYRVYEGAVSFKEKESSGNHEAILLSSGEEFIVSDGKYTSIAGEKIQVTNLNSWEKLQMFEFLPILFVELEAEYQALLLAKNGAKIDLRSESAALYQDERLLLREMMNSERDESRYQKLNDLMTLTLKQIALNAGILYELEAEREIIIRDKKEIDSLFYTVKKQSDDTDAESLKKLIHISAGQFIAHSGEREEDRSERKVNNNFKEREIDKLNRSRIEIVEATGTYLPSLSGIVVLLDNEEKKDVSIERETLAPPSASQSINNRHRIAAPVRTPVTVPPAISEDNQDRTPPSEEIGNPVLKLPDSLYIKKQPGDAVAGEVVLPNPEVVVVDKAGKPLPDITVTASIDKGTLGKAVQVVKTSAEGKASFENLIIEKSGLYKIDFSVDNIAAVTSSEFVINPSSICMDNSEITLPATIMAGNDNVTPVITIRDRYGNTIIGDFHVIVRENGDDIYNDFITFDEGVATLSFSVRESGLYKDFSLYINDINMKEFGFLINAAEPEILEVITNPEDTEVGLTLEPAPMVRVTDAYDNSVAGLEVKLYLERIGVREDSASELSTLKELTASETDEEGIAYFKNVLLTEPGEYRLAFRIPTQEGFEANSSSFLVYEAENDEDTIEDIPDTIEEGEEEDNAIDSDDVTENDVTEDDVTLEDECPLSEEIEEETSEDAEEDNVDNEDICLIENVLEETDTDTETESEEILDSHCPQDI